MEVSPFNDDIIPLILDNFYFVPGYHADTEEREKYEENHNSLKACSLVSKSWQRPAQRMLFHHLQVIRGWQVKSLRDILGSETMHTKFLAGSVRILEISINSPGTGRSICPITFLAPCMRLFPLLYELNVECTASTPLTPPEMEELNNTPAIRAFRFVNYARQSLIPLQLLRIGSWPLEFVQLKTPPLENLRSIEELPLITHRFYEIGLNITSEGPDNSHRDLLAYLARSSSDSLEVLRTHSIKDISISSLMHLTSLTLTIHPGAEFFNSSIGPIMFGLRELIIITAHGYTHSSSLYKYLPPALAHLAIGFPYPERDYVMDLVAHLPTSLTDTLVNLHFNSSYGGWDSGDYEFEIKELYPRTNIYFTSGESRVLKREALLKHRSPYDYPREMTAENMHRRLGL